jgi:AhpD family alkylhydroperoxidase
MPKVEERRPTMNEALPARAGKLATEQPDVWQAYQEFGRACAESGPLDERTRRLVKLALAVGRGSEGAVHSHTRRALAEGISADELRQVALLGATTLGFPAAVAALTWIEDIAGAP